MKQIICVKPCTISGQQFVAGEIIPVELVAAGREKSLERIGVLHVMNVDDAKEPAAEKESKSEDVPTAEVEPTEDGTSEETLHDKQTVKSKPGKKVQE